MSDKNVNDYQLVQTGPASWGLQYGNGEFQGGFPTAAVAQEQARATIAASTAAPTVGVVEPRSAAEASELADAARMGYLAFTGQNPLATPAELAPYQSQIARYDAYVNDFASKQALARATSLDSVSQQQIEQSQNLATADAQRRLLSDQAVSLRATGAPTDTIVQAEARAFEAEKYYQDLLNAQTAGNVLLAAQANTSVDPNNIAFTAGVANSSLMAQPTAASTATFGADYVDVSRPTSFDFGIGSFLTDVNNVVNTANNFVSNRVNQLTSGLGGLGNIGGQISGALGGTSGSSTFSSTGSPTPTTSTSEMRVRILAKDAWKGQLTAGILAPLKDIGGVLFPFTPTITYQASANYNTITTVHAIQDWHIFQNTPSVQLVINGTFTAQNDTEAKYLLAAIHFFRTATKMHFGEQDQNKGLPPPQMWLYGYGSHMFNQLSVIINSYNVDMPNNVDYVDAEVDGVTSRVPVVTNITVTCTVQNTPKKSREFDWTKFASGELMKAGRWL